MVVRNWDYEAVDMRSAMMVCVATDGNTAVHQRGQDAFHGDTSDPQAVAPSGKMAMAMAACLSAPMIERKFAGSASVRRDRA
jgi:hypothetical protein